MLRLSNIAKSFGSNAVLSDVSFDVRPGEVHVLFGENGAGKSTLMNIATGMLEPDAGTIEVDGHSFSRLTSGEAQRLGIATVFQEFSLVPTMTVVDNLFLGRELRGQFGLRKTDMKREAKSLLQRVGFALDVSAEVSSLSRAEQQMVEIAKALMGNASVIIFDEPTASLTDSEADHVLETIRRLREKGMGIVYISHRMREIRALADRVTVLRSGGNAGTVEAADVTEDRLVEMMAGRRIDALYPHIEFRPGAIRLELKGVSTNGVLKNASIAVRAGEIVGVAGLVGCGKGEIGSSVFGLSKITSGAVELDGRPVRMHTPRAMMRQGVAYFPADRNADGLALNLSVAENVAVASTDHRKYSDALGRIKFAAEKLAVVDAMSRLKLRPNRIDLSVKSLSGGNRQKAMLGRGLMREFGIFIFDEPTVGIDVGAKTEVYAFIHDLVNRGAAVLLISSELLEVTSLSHRIYVVHDGHVVRELQGECRTQEKILASFFDKPGAHRVDGNRKVTKVFH